MIVTEKLEIIPLNSFQLHLFIKQDPLLKEALRLHEMQHTFSKELLEKLEHCIIPKTASPQYNTAFICLWIVVLKKTRAVIGDICFKGEPNDKGEIEIGYETYLPYRRQGYMTEAVGGMVHIIDLNSIFILVSEENHQNKINDYIPFFYFSHQPYQQVFPANIKRPGHYRYAGYEYLGVWWFQKQ